MNTIDFETRFAIPNDLTFIFDSFRQDMMNNSYYGKSCRNSLFNREFPKVIDHILSKSKVLVAATKEDTNVVIGYLIYEPPSILHYAYVKKAFWNLKVFKRLFKTAFGSNDVVHASLKTQMGKKLMHKFNKLEANPFLLLKRGVENG